MKTMAIGWRDVRNSQRCLSSRVLSSKCPDGILSRTGSRQMESVHNSSRTDSFLMLFMIDMLCASSMYDCFECVWTRMCWVPRS